MALPAPVPANSANLLDQFSAFVELVRILRRECPWDRKQTHESLTHLFIEEAYEMIDAVRSGDDREFSKELGDLLLHIILHGVIAEERGAFSLIDILQQEREKLVFRHPHVFSDVQAQTPEEVKQNWEQIKLKEKTSSTDKPNSVLQGVPASAPALLRAQRMQDKAAGVKFDWPDSEGVWTKIREEIAEFEHELYAEHRKPEQLEMEFGDVLFSLVNAGRHAGIIAEEALQRTNDKFRKRFQYIENQAQVLGKSLPEMTLHQMDELWEKAKLEERKIQDSASKQ